MNISIFVATAHAVTVSTALPGMPTGVVTDPATYITGFYQLALTFAGILAFGAIVYGGIKYAVGRGNPSSESEGKSWITNALLGLLLLVGAYIILFTINPQLVTLNIQGLSPLQSSSSASSTVKGVEAGGQSFDACVGNCKSPLLCHPKDKGWSCE